MFKILKTFLSRDTDGTTTASVKFVPEIISYSVVQEVSSEVARIIAREMEPHVRDKILSSDGIQKLINETRLVLAQSINKK